MGPDQNFWPWLSQFFVAQVGSGWVSQLRFGFGKIPLKIPIFLIFSLLVKKISLGGVKKYSGQRRVGLLFTAGQKYMLELGQGPYLEKTIPQNLIKDSSGEESVSQLSICNGFRSKFLPQVGPIFGSSGWVRSAIYCMGLENYP